jgi:hypothetical protein
VKTTATATTTTTATAKTTVNTGVSPLRRKGAPSVEMTEFWGGEKRTGNSNDNDNDKCQYRGLSAAAQVRASGRDDKLFG